MSHKEGTLPLGWAILLGALIVAVVVSIAAISCILSEGEWARGLH